MSDMAPSQWQVGYVCGRLNVSYKIGVDLLDARQLFAALATCEQASNAKMLTVHGILQTAMGASDIGPEPGK